MKNRKIKQQKQGKLIVVYGPMFSGKTAYLIELVRKEKQIIVFKPSIDVRYTDRPVLRTHDGVEASAIRVDIHKPGKIWDKYKELKQIRHINTVLIDEVNLYDSSLIAVVKRLLNDGVMVVAAGILLDTEKGDFGQTSTLMSLADETKPLYAQCGYRGCTKPAPYTYAKKIKSTQIVVGADDLYGAACEEHYDRLHIPGKSESVAVSIKHDVISELVHLGVYPAYAEWVRSVRFPYLRRPTGKVNMSQLRLEIAGEGFSLGKSTLMREIADKYIKRSAKVATFDDLAKANPFTREDYPSDPEKVYLAEKWFIDQKYQQLTHLPIGAITIVNVTPEMEFCYAVSNVLAGRMSIQHFYDFEKHFYKYAWKRIPAPDLLLFITHGPQKNNLDKGRSNINDNIGDGQYQTILKIINQAWLKGLDKTIQVIEIRSEELKSKLKRQRLIKTILKQLNG